ncbi:MAG: hypothetical protein ACKVZJ_03895 [Phycisphaerales bacterium]
MSVSARPHISAALQHLRFGVTLSGSMLCLALVAQLIVWGCVHFMDLRTKRLGPEGGAGTTLTVVTRGSGPGESAIEKTAPRAASGPGLSSRSLVDGSSKERGSATGAALAAEDAPVPTAVDVNLVKAPGDLMLGRFAGVVQTIGIIAALAMALLLVQGVLISAGAQAPGVEYCVTASFWGIVIACLCVPMTGLVPGSAFPGVFASYGVMAEMADLYRLDAPTALAGPGYYGLFCGLPMAVAMGVAACVLRFRAGVEEGVLVTSVSQLDEKIEREIRVNRDKWSMMGGRAVGALNKAMGDPIVRGPGSGAGGRAGAGHAGGAGLGSTGGPMMPGAGSSHLTGMAAGAEGMGPRPGEPPEAPPGLALRRPI